MGAPDDTDPPPPRPLRLAPRGPETPRVPVPVQVPGADAAGLRGAVERSTRASEAFAQALDAMRMASDARALAVSLETRGLSARVESLEVAQLRAIADQHETRRKVDALLESVGKPPAEHDVMRASHSDTTPEELARLQAGYGIAGQVALLGARMSRVERRLVGAGAVVLVGQGLVPVIVEVVKSLF